MRGANRVTRPGTVNGGEEARRDAIITCIVSPDGRITRTGVVVDGRARWSDGRSGSGPRVPVGLLGRHLREVATTTTSLMVNVEHVGRYILIHEDSNFERELVHELAHLDDHGGTIVYVNGIAGTLHHEILNAFNDVKCEQAAIERGFKQEILGELDRYARLSPEKIVAADEDTKSMVLGPMLARCIRYAFFDDEAFQERAGSILGILAAIGRCTLHGTAVSFQRLPVQGITGVVARDGSGLPTSDPDGLYAGVNALLRVIAGGDVPRLAFDREASEFHLDHGACHGRAG